MTCELDRAAGRETICPEQECVFWVDGRCVIAGLRADWPSNPALVSLLRGVRFQLAPSGGRELLPPGLRS